LIGLSSLYAQTIDDQSKLLFEKYSNCLGQIEVIEKVTHKRSSLGSGFQIDAEGLVITNYHVISDPVLHSDKYYLIYVNQDETRDSLAILGFDIVNDLAVLRKENIVTNYLELENSELKKGTKLYSLGNPLDLGMSIIEGTYNGFLEDRRKDNIFFSGSLNSGMSGGPTIDKYGKVVGVNVSKGGEQLSFLVPTKYLTRLLKKIKDNGKFETENYSAIIEEQLLEYQDEYMNILLENEWTYESFGDFQVIEKPADFLHEWGNSEDEQDAKYEYSYSGFYTRDDVYVSEDISTSSISIRFEKLESTELNSTQFYNLYFDKFSKYLNPGYGEEEEHSEFVTSCDFVKIAERDYKTALAIREYKKYPLLYDFVFNAALLTNENKGLILKLSLSGVSRENGLAFLHKFLEAMK
jgi:hypothetical protein